MRKPATDVGGRTEGRTNVGRKCLPIPGPGRPAERATVALQRSASPKARPGQASTAGFEVVRHWAMEAASRAEAAAEVSPSCSASLSLPLFRVSPGPMILHHHPFYFSSYQILTILSSSSSSSSCVHDLVLLRAFFNSICHAFNALHLTFSSFLFCFVFFRCLIVHAMFLAPFFDYLHVS